MTLTETAKLTKRGFIIFAILIFVSTTGWFGYQYYYYNIYLPNLPKVEEKPDTKFGILPKINIATQSASTANFSYSLDTTTGDLPANLPKIMKVYFIPQLGSTLLAPDRAKNLANSFQFNSGPDQISSTEYRFTDNNHGEFLIDLNTTNFKYVHRLLSASDAAALNITQDTILPIEQNLAQEFKDYLSSKGLLNSDLSGSRFKVVYEKTNNRDSSNARISLWQKDIDTFPVVTPNFDTGLVNGLITKFKEETQRHLILNYTYWQIDNNTFATYPIKNAQAAFADLKGGQGVFTLTPISNTVSITKVYLGYMIQDSYTPYLQPVYVFEGPNFAAIVPAIILDYQK